MEIKTSEQAAARLEQLREQDITAIYGSPYRSKVVIDSRGKVYLRSERADSRDIRIAKIALDLTVVILLILGATWGLMNL